MSTTDDLNVLQGHAAPDIPSRGHPARIWAADVTVVNDNGTIDCQPVWSRATKIGVQVPVGYKPTVGDRVLITDLNGDPRTPIMLVGITTTPPSVTGSRGGNIALGGLLTQLAALGLIANNTTP